jgi:hypothetical protein
MDGGFLANPTSEAYSAILKHLVTTDAVPAAPALVLLGEAGLGKSVEVRRFAGGAAHFIDLGDFGDEALLERAVNEGFEAARLSGSGAPVVLDALDEVLIGIPKATSVILRCLRKQQPPHPGVVVTCRTGAWPGTFGQQLAQVLGAERETVFELAMLRRADVGLAATSSGLDAAQFFQALSQVSGEPLAASPATLRLLIQLLSTGGLPRTRTELYELGLLKLCEQPPERRDRGSEPADGARTLTPGAMLAVASRIAAMTVLSGRSQVSIQGVGEVQPGAVHMSEFAGGVELAGDDLGAQVEVTENAVRETLKHTGLFSARNAGVLGFAHRSFGEYLAARFLARAKLQPVQLSSVVDTEGAAGRRVVPQLAETAAWLSDLDTSFRARVLRDEPGILFRSDVRAWNEGAKQELVGSLLDAVRTGRLPDLDHAVRQSDEEPFRTSIRRFLGPLGHTGLPEQLGPIIRDGREPEAVREAAIEIAAASRSPALADTCADVALDQAAPPELRRSAAYVVRAIRDREACKKLLPLVSSPGDDPQDDLKGCALWATWPDHLSTMQMLESLTAQKRENLHGAYAAFLSDVDLRERITDADLPLALAWAGKHPDIGDSRTPVGIIASQVAYEGWMRQEAPGVLAALAELTIRRVAQRSLLLRTPGSPDDPPRYRRDEREAAAKVIQGDEVRRRVLLGACLKLLRDREHVRELAWMSPVLVAPGDFGWALDRACELPDAEAERFAWLADAIGMRRDPISMDQWLVARDRTPVVRRVLNYPTETVLSSPEAKKAWWRWARSKVQERTRDWRWRRELPADTRSERLNDLLDRCERMDVRWWPHLSDNLQYNDDWEATFHFNLTTSPGWMLGDDAIHKRVATAAKRYLIECRIEDKGDNDPGIDNLAAIRAAILLVASDGAMPPLDDVRINEVAPALLGGISSWKEDEAEHCVAIARECFQRAPAASRDALCELVVGAMNEFLPEVMGLKGLVTPESTRLELLRLATSTLRGHKVFERLLHWLIESGTPGAVPFALSLLGPGTPGDEASRVQAKAAAQSLLQVPEMGWDAIWRSVKSDAAWGDELLRTIVPYDTGQLPPLGERIDFSRLGEAVEYLMERFAPEDDPEHDEVYSPSKDEYVRRWRSELLRTLMVAGTADAVAALRRMRDRWPQRTWLARVVAEAEARQARAAWSPIPPRHLLQLREDAGRRSVRTGVELLEVLSESLRRFEKKMREDDTVAMLWDEVSTGVWRPKNEESLSDAIVAHLRADLHDRGVIVGRELQISRRRSKEGEAGMRLDIGVTAVSVGIQAGVEPIRAVIEVKGSWNQEAVDGLEKQLAGRYLREHGASHGLFVVGWYEAAGWCREDARRRSGPWCDLTAARSALADQSVRVSRATPGLTVESVVLDCGLR